jgi:pSer/pThr/pTyr-binding forkhead associated (FHA) protein
MIVVLKVLDGPESGRTYEFETGPVTIGRDPSNGVVLHGEASAVSRQHAELRCVANEWSIVDLGSTNGTHIGGRRVSTALVHHGDVIRFGSGGPQLAVSLPGSGGDRTTAVATPQVPASTIADRAETAVRARSGRWSAGYGRFAAGAVVTLAVMSWMLGDSPSSTGRPAAPAAGEAGTAEAGSATDATGRPAPQRPASDGPAGKAGDKDAAAGSGADAADTSDDVPGGRAALPVLGGTLDQLAPRQVGRFFFRPPVASSQIVWSPAAAPVAQASFLYWSVDGVQAQLDIGAFGSAEEAVLQLGSLVQNLAPIWRPTSRDARPIRAADGRQLGWKCLLQDSDRRIVFAVWSNGPVVFHLFTPKSDAQRFANEHPYYSYSQEDLAIAKPH